MDPRITELERQLAEKHRQLDAEYAERIRLIQAECAHDTGGPLPKFMRVHYNGKYIGPAFPRFQCIKCGAPMSLTERS